MVGVILFYSIFLFLSLDLVSQLPELVLLLKPFSRIKVCGIVLRETLLGFLFLLLFYCFGEKLLVDILGLSIYTIRIASAFFLELLAMRFIFANDLSSHWVRSKGLFFFPIASPLIAGPGPMAVIMILGGPNGSFASFVLIGLLVCLVASYLVLAFAVPLYAFVTRNGLLAVQRLVGLVLCVLATEAVVEGLRKLFSNRGI